MYKDTKDSLRQLLCHTLDDENLLAAFWGFLLSLPGPPQKKIEKHFAVLIAIPNKI